MINLVSDTIDLPDGTYAGIWSAYTITVNEIHALKTEVGCRSFSGVDVIVRVSNGRATAEAS